MTYFIVLNLCGSFFQNGGSMKLTFLVPDDKA